MQLLKKLLMAGFYFDLSRPKLPLTNWIVAEVKPFTRWKDYILTWAGQSSNFSNWITADVKSFIWKNPLSSDNLVQFTNDFLSLELFFWSFFKFWIIAYLTNKCQALPNHDGWLRLVHCPHWPSLKASASSVGVQTRKKNYLLSNPCHDSDSLKQNKSRVACIQRKPQYRIMMLFLHFVDLILLHSKFWYPLCFQF